MATCYTANTTIDIPSTAFLAGAAVKQMMPIMSRT